MKKFLILIAVTSVLTTLTGCNAIKSEIKDELDYNENTQQQNKISQADAESIALKNAGFTVEEISNLRTEYGYDDGRYEYDIEFYTNGFEYSYEIDAFTGEILKSEKDND